MVSNNDYSSLEMLNNDGSSPGSIVLHDGQLQSPTLVWEWFIIKKRSQ